MVRDGAGNFPTLSDQWRKLPGIGRYTAAAIASIVFNEPVAVLDGNVERVLRRLLHATYSTRQSWSAAQELLGSRTPGRLQSGNDGIGRNDLLARRTIVWTVSDQNLLPNSRKRRIAMP